MYQRNARYLRIMHTGLARRSIYLTDIDAPLVNKAQNAKQAAYVPLNGYIDVLLTDRVITSYQQGQLRKYTEGGFLNLFILDNPALTVSPSAVANIVLKPDDRYLLVDSSTGPVDVFLPFALDTNQESVTIKRSSLDSNPITVHIQPGDLIDGSVTSYTLLDPSDWVELFPDGSAGWWRSGEYNPGGGGGGGSIAVQEFNVVNPLQLSYVLLSVPLANSLDLYLNGLHLTQGAGRDYTLVGNTINLVAGTPLFVGDFISAKYTV